VGEIAVSGPIQAGPQDLYGAFYQKNAFAREHTIGTTTLGGGCSSFRCWSGQVRAFSTCLVWVHLFLAAL